jgi:hypothetical protein
MKIPKTPLVCACLIAFAGGAWAIEYGTDEGTDAQLPTLAHELFLLAPVATRPGVRARSLSPCRSRDRPLEPLATIRTGTGGVKERRALRWGSIGDGGLLPP